MKTFNPSSKHPARALQAWQILISVAMRKETITYQELSILMYQKDARGVMNHILGRIANYCDKNGLPQLNALDWYNVYPPNESELQHSDCLSAA